MSKVFDAGIDFETTYTLLSTALSDKQYSNQRNKVAILLIALRNGSRVGEAIDAYNQFIATKNRDLDKVRVEKQGYTRIYRKDKFGHLTFDENGEKELLEKKFKPEYRNMIIPPEVTEKLPAYKQTRGNICMFSKKAFKFNPHSARYAFITHLTKKGKMPQEIAAITRHKTLDMILKYTQRKEGIRALKEDVL